jgi:ribosomal protein L15
VFSYGKLSDLKTGELVVPIRATEGGVLCRKENGLEVVFKQTDFDFGKKVEERSVTSLEEMAKQMEVDTPEEEVQEEAVAVEAEADKEYYEKLIQEGKQSANRFKQEVLRAAGINTSQIDKVKLDMEFDKV